MKLYIGIVTIYTLIILYVDEQHLVRASVCGGIYFLAEIGFVLKQLLEQKKEEAKQIAKL